jgi:hypothetical protein
MRPPGGFPVLLWLALSAAPAAAQGTAAHIDASAAGAVSSAPDVNRQYLLRVIPRLDTGTSLTPTWKLDVSASVAATTGQSYLSGRQVSDVDDVSLHRAWVRLASPRFEARVGMQHISFGSAAVFRPLMWFDRLDARDPAQFTEGVYAALARYVTAGNASVWAWGLYGNNAPRGWDTLATQKGTAEFGGRVQLPVPRGEIAGSYHHRRIDTTPLAAAPIAAGGQGTAAPLEPTANPTASESSAGEDRFGFDGKWDLGIGLWIETSFVRSNSALLRGLWRPSYAVGADYTFAVGSGLTVLGEHFFLEAAVPSFSPPAELKITALTATYPVGVANALTVAVYYEWNRDDVYRFIEWRRTYDHWRLHVVGFWNPDRASLFAPGSQANALTGKGIELVLVASY